MQIWPAIDLLGGKCVRLEQGDYQRSTVYSDDPVAVAKSFEDQGARHLHLVDLDGARDGKPTNYDAVQAIVESVDLECELGGGIRDQDTIKTVLDTVMRSAQTGQIGDGQIFVVDLADTIRIRTGETGEEAL